jgi:hypothetical protein
MLKMVGCFVFLATTNPLVFLHAYVDTRSLPHSLSRPTSVSASTHENGAVHVGVDDCQNRRDLEIGNERADAPTFDDSVYVYSSNRVEMKIHLR